MSVVWRGATKSWQRRRRGTQLAISVRWLLGVVVCVACWHSISTKTMWIFVADAPWQALDLATRLVPPKWSYMSRLWRPLWDTLNMATLGTLLALLIALPVALCAARNTTPSAVFVRPVALGIIVASRSINSLLWALMLVTVLGPGVLAGIIAIGLRSIGFVAKLLYEAIEEIDPTPVEAVTATGASRAQVVTFGIVPQVLPAFAGIAMFRWDINARESTVLGLVGAGGLGLQLDASIANLAWTQVSMILLVILGVVAVSEWVSARLRNAML